MTLKFSLLRFYAAVKKHLLDQLKTITADGLLWITAIVLHASTVPNLVAYISALTDKPAPFDLVLFVWSALAILFARAVLLKDLLNIITIGAGFMLQAGLLGFILFR